MSAMVEICVGELSKLREKVLSQKPFFPKSKEGSSKAQEKEAIDACKKNRAASETDKTTMSDATMCLLMDRFVPC